MDSRFYAYLRGPSPLGHVFGEAWIADFMHIYVVLALLGMLCSILGLGSHKVCISAILGAGVRIALR